MAEKKQYSLEYPFKSSPKILYNCISTPSGLAEWFADDVNIRDNVYTFIWEGAEQEAEMVTSKPNELVRFRWVDEPDDTFFEFRIQQDELTSEIALIITDFAEDGEKEEAVLLWDTQVNDLHHVIGS